MPGAVSALRRHRAAALLTLLVLASAGLRAAAAQAFTAPWIAPDEMIYGLLGQSLWETGELALRGQESSYYSLLYPALVGAPLLLDDLAAGIAFVQVLQGLVVSTVAVVVYGWGRGFLPERLALAAAGLSVLPPALAYSGLLMTEALFYPVVVLCLAVVARTLAEPTVFSQGMLVGAVTVAAAVRMQALVLLPVIVTAALLDAAFARSSAALRKLAPALVLVSLTAVGGVLVTALSQGLAWSTLLGAYGTVTESAPGVLRAAEELVWHAGGLFLLVLGVPLLATISLGVEAFRRGEPEPAARAFLATALAYSLWLVVEVALFASRYLTHVGERYLITAAPPLLLGLCLWLARGAPRPRAALVLAAVAVLAVAAVPIDRLASAEGAHDLFTTMPLVGLADRSPAGARAVVIAAAAVLAAAFALVPRRRLAALAGVLALGFASLSAAASRDIARYSERAQAEAFGTADADWIDRALDRDEDVLLLNSGDREWTTVARTLFWNASVRSVLRLPDASAYGPIPQLEVAPTATGELAGAGDATLVAAPAGVLLDGRKLAEVPPTEIQPGAALWRARSPLRLRQRTEGLQPNGDFAGLVRVSVFGCRPGALELTLIGKSGAPVAVRVDGVPLPELRPPRDALWLGAVPAPPYADGASTCVFELESGGLVGSTRIEFVPASRPLRPARGGRAGQRRDDDELLEPRLDAGGQLALGALEPRAELLLGEQVEGGDVAAADPLERLLALERAAPGEPRRAELAEAGRRQLAPERGGRREALAVDRGDAREPRVQPVDVEVLRRERRDRDAAAGNEHARGLGERRRPLEQVDDEREHDRVEPTVAEGQPLGAAVPEPGGPRNARAGDGEHALARLHAPDARVRALGQRRRERPGAAADVEDARAAERAELHERLEALPPGTVLRAQRVVRRRPPAEVGPRAPLGRRDANPRSARPAR